MVWTAPSVVLPVLAAVLTAALAVAARECGRRRAAAVQARDQALAEASRARQVLRLAAGELRAPALKLLGNVDWLRRAAPAGPGGFDAGLIALDGIAAHLLSLADDLQAQETAGEPRVIDAEHLRLAPLLDDAVGAVAAGIAPGRRRWRIADAIGSVVLDVDRRAIREVLVRVLSSAVRLSGDGDEIDISVDRQGGWLRLIVADEGQGQLRGDDAGMVAPGAPQFRTRGVNLGLALARQLIEAMDGRLGFESVLNVGTRITVELPQPRVGDQPPPPPPAVRAPALLDAAPLP